VAYKATSDLVNEQVREMGALRSRLVAVESINIDLSTAMARL